MNPNQVTTKNLSQALKELGCDIESDWYWAKFFGEWHLVGKDFDRKDYLYYPAYSYLDIMTVLAKKFFGEEWIDTGLMENKFNTLELMACDYYPKQILSLIQQSKTQEAEAIILEQYKLNNK